MNTLKTLFTIAFLQSAILSFGQTNAIQTDQQYIEVIGTAEKEVIPDEIYIGIIIRERYDNKIKITIEEQEEKLKTALKSLGIDLANLYLMDANADYVKIRWQKNDVLTKKDYTVKVSNTNTVGQVFQELDKLEITDAYISKVNHSKLDSLKKDVKIMAIKSAKEKAEYLLNAIGEQAGEPLIIKELETEPLYSIDGVNVQGSRSENRGYYTEGKNYGDKVNDEIQFQKIKIKSNIYIKFSIK